MNLLIICNFFKAIITHSDIIFIAHGWYGGFFGTTFITHGLATLTTVVLSLTYRLLVPHLTKVPEEGFLTFHTVVILLPFWCLKKNML